MGTCPCPKCPDDRSRRRLSLMSPGGHSTARSWRQCWSSTLSCSGLVTEKLLPPVWPLPRTEHAEQTAAGLLRKPSLLLVIPGASEEFIPHNRAAGAPRALKIPKGNYFTSQCSRSSCNESEEEATAPVPNGRHGRGGTATAANTTAQKPTLAKPTRRGRD